jgi:hypothetical protein
MVNEQTAKLAHRKFMVYVYVRFLAAPRPTATARQSLHSQYSTPFENNRRMTTSMTWNMKSVIFMFVPCILII